MSQRSAGGFRVRPRCFFLEMLHLKAGVTSLQTCVLCLIALAPTPPPFCVLQFAASLLFRGGWISTLSETFPRSSVGCVRVPKCLSWEAIGLCDIYLKVGRRWQRLALPLPSLSPCLRGGGGRGGIPYSERVCAGCLRVRCLRPTVQVNW